MKKPYTKPEIKIISSDTNGGKHYETEFADS